MTLCACGQRHHSRALFTTCESIPIRTKPGRSDRVRTRMSRLGLQLVDPANRRVGPQVWRCVRVIRKGVARLFCRILPRIPISSSRNFLEIQTIEKEHLDRLPLRLWKRLKCFACKPATLLRLKAAWRPEACASSTALTSALLYKCRTSR